MKTDLSALIGGAENRIPLDTAFDLTGLTGDVVSGTASVSGAFENHSGYIELCAEIRCRMQVRCARCARVFDTERAFPVRCAVKVGGEELDDGECVCVPPDGEVDTDELFAGILLPLFPSRFLCSEDCRGLCPVCGRDLNTGSCGCGTRPVDPRLEKLRALLEEDKK